jgi:hypothetical protein
MQSNFLESTGTVMRKFEKIKNVHFSFTYTIQYKRICTITVPN